MRPVEWSDILVVSNCRSLLLFWARTESKCSVRGPSGLRAPAPPGRIPDPRTWKAATGFPGRPPRKTEWKQPLRARRPPWVGGRRCDPDPRAADNLARPALRLATGI